MYDSDDEVTLATGHAHVYRFPAKKQSQGLQPGADAEPGWIVCKQIEAGAVVPPHNLRQEVELLHSFDHDNIIRLLSYERPAGLHRLFMPYYPITLSALLDQPDFTPASCPAFTQLFRHFSRQMLAAVAYLHDQMNVAHRDVNPKNFVIGRQGHVKLIDFGIAIWADQRPKTPLAEGAFDVGTGPYKAPELLFSHAELSSTLLDLWSLGVTLAQFFTTISETSTPAPIDQDSADDLSAADMALPPWATSFIRPKQDKKPVYLRQCLFDDSHGEIGLAASIFKVLGTPTLETWPEANAMPVFQNLPFHHFEASGLQPHLLHLPPSTDNQRPIEEILSGLLQISASARSPATQALNHDWLKKDVESQVSIAEALSPYLSNAD